MDEKDNSQLELFSGSGESYQYKKDNGNRALFLTIKNYEKIIVLVIAFILVAVVFFSLGVERGKKILASKDKIKEAQVVHVAKNIAATEEKLPEQKALLNKEGPATIVESGYIIQLACYKTKSYAQTEAEQLKKNGLNPLILTKGDYVVLCIGTFTDRENAKAHLSELKKRYKDCYIRRL